MLAALAANTSAQEMAGAPSVQSIIAASDRADLIAKTRSLDRVLLNSHYVISNWHIRDFRVAYWSKFQRPSVSPPYGLGLDTWWIDSSKEATVEAKKQEIKGQ